MIGLDTNILVRYLTHDEPAQARKAAELIERLTIMSPGFISVVAFAETAWVLQRVFGIAGPKLADTLKKLLEVDCLVVEHEREVYSALRVLKDGRGSFGDGIIAALGHKAGCAYTCTFDEKATRLSQFRQI